MQDTSSTPLPRRLRGFNTHLIARPFFSLLVSRKVLSASISRCSGFAGAIAHHDEAGVWGAFGCLCVSVRHLPGPQVHRRVRGRGIPGTAATSQQYTDGSLV